jgi:hypothetical protein
LVARRTPLVLWLGAGAVGVFTVLALRSFPLPQGSAFTICFVRRFTGLSCPGCGLTRAFASLARGDWAEAFRLHPLSFLIAAELAGGWAIWGAGLLRARALVSRRSVNLLLAANAVLLVVVWAARFALGTLPP